MVPSGHPWPSWIMLTLAGAGVLIFGHTGLLLVSKGSKLARWQECKAKITSLDVSERQSKIGDSIYDIKTTYVYEFNGGAYAGTKVSILDFVSSIFSGYDRVAKTQISTKYEEQHAISVLVDPENPQDSVILDIPIGKYLIISTAMLLLAMACFVLDLLFQNPSPASVGAGSSLGFAGYYLWTRWDR